MILVTGGTGLVGSHVLYRLSQTNDRVRAIYRRKHKIESVKKVFSYYTNTVESLFEKIEWVEADITNIPKLEDAFVGITYVYHCAAFVSFEPDKYRALRNINIKGTANIVNLCIANSVKKLIYVSSIAALGHPLNPEEPITEDTPWNTEADHSVYAITKYGAELEVWRGTQEGVDSIIVNPGVVIGPGYWRGGSSGSLFTKVYRNNSYYTKGSTGYVDVFDVTDSMIQLMESLITNDRFILVSENLDIKTFINEIADCLQVSKSKKEAKPWLLNILWRLDWVKHKVLGKRRRLTKHLAKSLVSKSHYDNSKIKTALGYSFKPIKDSISQVGALFIEDSKTTNP